MSSVTGLHLLSQSMLNVSCQKQKHCSSLPTDSLTESPMEFVGQPRPSGACSLLGVPGLSTLDLDLDEDEGEVVIGIRPKSSPLPRRRTSDSEEDSEPEPPLCGSRRVSFADAKGLSLVQVKEFDTWDVPKLPGYFSESEGEDTEEYILSPLTFSRPLSTEELFVRVREQKIELETIELLPGTTILKGVIRVLNISFNKAIYVRTTLDTWSTHFDLLAEYLPGSSDSLTDCFSFRLTLVPPFEEQGARVDFCLRYETPVGTFWANNNNKNYVLFCYQRAKEREEKPKREDVNKKSCLKTVSHNFSTLENSLAMETSSQENVSTDVSKQGENVDTMKTKQMSNGQSGTSEEDKQKSLAESHRNCRRRNRRRAARMARVRDHFAQRSGGANDAERDETPPEVKQATQEQTPEDKHSDVQSFSEGSSKSDGHPFVSESLEPIPDVVHDTSQAHDNTSNSEPEKSENISLADSATLTGGESDISDKPLHSRDDPAPAERQSSQKQGMSPECPSNIGAEPADNISAMNSESLVSQTNSFTFGTVVAPLYHQVFGRVGSESQSSGDWGNPVWATLNVEDLTQSYPATERRETSCSVPSDAGGNDEKVKENVIKTLEESEQECLHSPHIEEEEEEEETSLDHSATLQDPVIRSDQKCTNTSEVPKTISADIVTHPHSVNILNTDLSNPQTPTESLHLQGEAQEDSLTHDLQSRTTAEKTQAQPLEHTRTQIKTNLDETLRQSETEEVMTHLETSFMSLQPSQSVPDETDQQTSGGSNNSKCVDESHKDDDVAKTVTTSTNSGISEDKLLDALHDLNSNHINNSASKETENGCVSCVEILEETDVTAPQISLETHEETNNVEEENKEATISNYHIYGDMFMELKDEDTLKYEEITVSEKIEHQEMEACVSKQENICLADTAAVKNWEMMVEEEEENILTDEEESEAQSSKADDTEAMEYAGTEVASENRDITMTEKEKTEDETVAITAARERENKAEDTDASEDKQRIGEHEIGENVPEVEKEFDYVQATKTEKAAEEEELAEETEAEKRNEQEETELEKEKHFAEIQEVTNERIIVQEEEEMESDEEMEIDLNSDDEAGVEWEDQVKPKEENPDYKEEIQVDEESEIIDAESDIMTIEDKENEVESFEERLDITQNDVEDSLFAPVHNVQDKRVTDKENTGEGQIAHIPTEMHLYKDKGFQSKENVTHDLSGALRDESESTAAEGGSCIFADEPESDQLSDNSTTAESDSDDEVELYMHCLRVVHAGAQAHKDRNKDTGFNVGKRPSVSKSKLLSTPMPSITESLDEEQHFSHLQNNHEDMETAVFQPTDAALQEPTGQESMNRNVSWWREIFSCSNITKTLLYATLFVVFIVVAYHYDFVACFGLYLVSVIWLCCQGERQTVKNTNKIG